MNIPSESFVLRIINGEAVSCICIKGVGVSEFVVIYICKYSRSLTTRRLCLTQPGSAAWPQNTLKAAAIQHYARSSNRKSAHNPFKNGS